jgi:hypothetical protein
MNSQNLSRRQFVWLTSCALGAGCMGLPAAFAAQDETEGWNPSKPFFTPAKKLKVQPVFMYSLPTRREKTSWKSWGGVQTEPAVAEECARIDAELKRLAKQAEFGLEILPLAKVTSPDAAKKLTDGEWDVTLVYACTGGGQTLRTCLELKPDALIFVRQRSGPVYYWYEALSTRYLRADSPAETVSREGREGREAKAFPSSSSQTSRADSPTGLRTHVDDVVVDDTAGLLWKLRALHAVKNFLGTRIVALGGPAGKYAADAPQKAQERFGLKIIDVSYDNFEPRIRRALKDSKVVGEAEAWTRRYLALPHTRLNTERQFVVNSFVLYREFKELMRENDASAFTIKACMGTIMPMAETTACLTLSLLNDEGLIAFCESDFVIIPSGLLLRHVTGRPVFLHNSTFPHKGMVTCAHCTAPRRMDGRRYEPVRIVTHYESDYGAAPKVDMPLGQQVTFVDPEYSTARWVGFKGTVKGNPFYDICRSQQDVVVQGDWRKLLAEARDSHWVMAYGDWLKELGYASRKVGVQWATLGETV